MRETRTLGYKRTYHVFFRVRGYIRVEIRHFVEAEEGKIVMVMQRAYYKQMGQRSLGLNKLTELSRNCKYGCKVDVYPDGYTLYFQGKDKK